MIERKGVRKPRISIRGEVPECVTKPIYSHPVDTTEITYMHIDTQSIFTVRTYNIHVVR